MRAVVFALIVLFLSSPVRADEPSKATMEAATKLAKYVLKHDSYEEKLDRMSKAIHDAQPLARQTKLSAAFWAKLRAGLEERVPYDQLVSDQAAAFAASYTADELKRLLTFYETPLGKKALKVMPEVMANATAKAQKHFDDILPMLLDELMKAEPPAKTP